MSQAITFRDTIAAQTTPLGRGGVGIIRISGQKTQEIALAILGEVPEPRAANFFIFKDQEQIAIDEGIAIFFPSPHSFTGEDVLELQGHGGVVVMDKLLRCVLRHGARIARPGEFSERAFLNHKIDLVQAEAIADLIDASSEQAAQSAIRSLQGEFSQRIRELQDQLTALRMMVEAAIDFPEEEIDFLKEQQVSVKLKQLIDLTECVQQAAKQGTILREGINVVIAGKPNAGKSSLLNAISGRDSAIVTEIAGTTRDLLREYIHIDGMPLHVVDTAGLRETEDVVEQEGLRRAWKEIERADVVLLVVDGSLEHQEITIKYADDLFEKINKRCPIVIVKNKIDLIKEFPLKKTINNFVQIQLSAKKHEGISLLKEHLKELMGCTALQEGTFIARRRHLNAIQQAKKHLETGLQQLLEHRAGELLADDLRLAQNHLSEITGQFTSDDLLGKIFATFCIGK